MTVMAKIEKNALDSLNTLDNFFLEISCSDLLYTCAMKKDACQW